MSLREIRYNNEVLAIYTLDFINKKEFVEVATQWGYLCSTEEIQYCYYINHPDLSFGKEVLVDAVDGIDWGEDYLPVTCFIIKYSNNT